jgi:hypothetical protein
VVACIVIGIVPSVCHPGVSGRMIRIAHSIRTVRPNGNEQIPAVRGARRAGSRSPPAHHFSGTCAIIASARSGCSAVQPSTSRNNTAELCKIAHPMGRQRKILHKRFL